MNQLKTGVLLPILLLCQLYSGSWTQINIPLNASGGALQIANYDPNYDPGKDITDDPHGPDPHDEQHDPNLPANNPDKYFPPPAPPPMPDSP